ncbi:MAG: ABC transporter permease subunit [bacterium]|nr:ABC transporter permease subunit [bacterium]
MIPTLKSEFRKLLTVRSTYFATAIIVALLTLFTYFGTSQIYVYEDQEMISEDSALAQEPTDQEKIVNDIEKPQEFAPPKISNILPDYILLSHLQSAIGLIGFITAVVAILFMAHEFRYNIINHTLTSSNNRSKVLLAKIIVVLAYTTLATILGIATVVAVTYIAVGIKDLIMPNPNIDWPYIVSRLLAYSVGMSLFALALITLLRNLTAGIVVLFVLPIIEQIIGGIIRGSNPTIQVMKYLPITSLSYVTNVYFPEGGFGDGPKPLTIAQALTTFLIGLVIVWAISWYLFLHRDAN